MGKARFTVMIFGVLALLATLVAAPAQSGPTATRPNIVYIMTDDLSSDIVPYMREVQAMINEGVSFSNYIVSNTLCCPSRAGFLTGKYPQNNQVKTNVWPSGGVGKFFKNDEQESVGVYLDNAGYRTGFMGKYLNQYQPKGNTGANGQPAYSPAYVPAGWDEAWLVDTGYQQFAYTLTVGRDGVSSIKQFKGGAESNYLTDQLAGEAVDFIGRNAASPFFLTLTPTAVHNSPLGGDPERPYQYPPAPRDRPDSPTRPVGWSEPEFPLGGDCGTPVSGGCGEVVFPSNPDNYNKIIQNRPAWAPSAPLGDADVARHRRNYLDRVRMAQSVDDLIGDVRAALVAAGVADNTYVIFGSDNGYHLGEHAMNEDKGTPYDHDVRVPFIVVPPGGTTPRTQTELVSNVDLLPTFAGIAGVTSFAEPIDGRSMKSLINTGAARSWRKSALVQYDKMELAAPRLDPDRVTSQAIIPTYRALRTATYLYTDYGTLDSVPPKDHWTAEYYDLASDPAQVINIYDRLSPERRAALNTALRDYARCAGSSCRQAGQVTP